MSITKKLLIISVPIVIAVGILCIFIFQTHSSSPGSLTISDRTGQELLFLSENSDRRKEVAISQIPFSVIASTLQTEDQRFAEHHGIDWIASARAIYDDIQAGHIVSGASTISQQVARNLLGTNRPRTLVEKAKDISLALLLERTYSKDEILDFYLNHIFYGNHTYGIAAAAQTYFDVPLSKLDWNQATLLAAIPQNASYLNPYRDMQTVRNRQLTIAKKLQQNQLIGLEEYQDIQNTIPQLSPAEQIVQAPHFGYFVLHQLEAQYGADFWHGHRVEVSTTLNRDWYRESLRLMQVELAKVKDKNVHNAAVVALDNATGEILSYVGNADYFDKSHNGAVDMIQALRQPGSALKPFIYLGTVMFAGLGTGSMFYDVPTNFLTAQNTPYTPLNYDLNYHGPVTMREALANSYNIPAVKALEKIGITKARQLLHDAGITSIEEDNDHYGLSLALGSAEVSLYQLTNAYRTLANQGTYSDPQGIIAVTIDGQTTTWPTAKKLTQTSWDQPSLLITDILQDKDARLAEFGENNALEFPYPVAAKTGTSRNFNDNWTIGFTPQVTVGVWVGNSDGQAMEQVSGISGAGPIFHQVMNVVNNNTNKTFKALQTLTSTTICLPSGLLPQPLCNHRSQEYFLPGTAPTSPDTWYQPDGLHLPTELHYWQQQFAVKSSTGLAIIAPHDQDVYTLDREIPLANQAIKCSIYAPNVKDLTIKLNQQVISHTTSCSLPFTKGKYTLNAEGMDPNGKVLSQTINYSVQ